MPIIIEIQNSYEEDKGRSGIETVELLKETTQSFCRDFNEDGTPDKDGDLQDRPGAVGAS